LIFSVCPPHAAESVADQVLSSGFKGIYVDANAISPQRSIQIGERLETGGINFVDGGIVGGPDWEGGSTCLYLSGEYAHRVAACFRKGPLQVNELGKDIGKASAIKMCYAAYTKGTTALISSILATSEYYGVREVLKKQWGRDWPGFDTQAEIRSTRVTAKAWRFAGEMKEIAATFMAAGLPGGFHVAAGDVYSRLANYKGRSQTPEIIEVLNSLLGEEK
jgi:3-hydroxyisobutyrate dehydrogenase-like beta-hydroxyacid dehydrogenase